MRFAALRLLAVITCLLVPATAGAADRLTCEGYPETRQFVEAQTWWMTTPGLAGTDFGHVHVGACIPERETLRADTTLDVRVIMHDNPGHFPLGSTEGLSLVTKTVSAETTVRKVSLNGFTCPVGTCEQWVTVPLKMADFNRSGLQEVRFRAFVDTPDAQVMIASLNFQVYIENAKTHADMTRLTQTRGKGWYTKALYCEAAMETVPLPDAPLTGVWQPTLAMQTHVSDGSLPVTHRSVTIDPDNHAHPPVPGTVLVDGLGPWTGQVTIDTSKLTTGPHRLVARADCNDPRGSTNSGVLVIPFRVLNGIAPPAAPAPAQPTPPAPESPASAPPGGLAGTAPGGIVPSSLKPLAGTSQSPSAAAPGSATTPPSGAKSCLVPSLKGKTVAGARKKLLRFNCALGKVKRAKGIYTGDPVRVYSQSPATGKTMAAGAKVAISVKALRRRS